MPFHMFTTQFVNAYFLRSSLLDFLANLKLCLQSCNLLGCPIWPFSIFSINLFRYCVCIPKRGLTRALYSFKKVSSFKKEKVLLIRPMILFASFSWAWAWCSKSRMSSINTLIYFSCFTLSRYFSVVVWSDHIVPPCVFSLFCVYARVVRWKRGRYMHISDHFGNFAR